MHSPVTRILAVVGAAGTLAGLGLAGGMAAVASPFAVPSLSAHGPAPFGRAWASWAYDPAQHDVVLFGGSTTYKVADRGISLGKTWTWNGRWTERHPGRSPSARTGAAMVYDAAAGQLLLFGGSTMPGFQGGYLGDTWIWNGATWRRLHPAASPPARHNADMVYDAATHDVILFGGYDDSYLAGTWSWNGATWTPLHPAAGPTLAATAR